MNTKDTELIYEAYNKRVVSFTITEEEAAQIFERSVRILFEYHDSLIQEGFISTGKKLLPRGIELATNQLKKSFPIVGTAATKAYDALLNVAKGTGEHKELIKNMVTFIKAAAQNNPDMDNQLITVATAALRSLPQEKIIKIVKRFSPPPLPRRNIAAPSLEEIKRAIASSRARTIPSTAAIDSLNQQTMGRLNAERFEGYTQRNLNTRYNLIEDVEFAIISGINREIIRENKVILNTVLDIVEEGIMGTAKSGMQAAKSGIQSTGTKALNLLQAALDVAGVEPTVGTAADVGNGLISLLRSAATKEPDQRKKHLLNAAISAVSIIPGADVVKLLKARKLTKPLAKGALAGAKALRTYKQGKAAAGKIALATGGNLQQSAQPTAASSSDLSTTWI
jgi:hypothetical protein